MTPDASTAKTCTECRRPLLWAHGALICTWRHCPVFGADQSLDADEQQTTSKREAA
jgi:hypothetical protein